MIFVIGFLLYTSFSLLEQYRDEDDVLSYIFIGFEKLGQLLIIISLLLFAWRYLP